MLQHPIDDSSYQCSMQQSSSRDYSSCTVVIRKREINDQIIEKQSFLIQRMKQDHIFVKRLLESKSNELIKMKNTLDLVQIENLELNVQVDSLKKQIELYAKQGKLDMVLQRQNAQLKEEIQTLKVEIREAANQHRKQFEKWTEELISLRQESFRLDFAQHTEETHGKIVHRLEKECRRLKNDLEKEKNINQRLKFENQKKLTISQPIKIVEPGEEEMPSKPYDDLVKGSLNAGHFKRSSKDEFEISLVKSSKQSDQLFQDSFNSGQQFYSPNHESLSYQRSEAQIQTERCEVIQTTILSRERIQRSLNHRKNNHMKNMDQYTRIMNLSKELNEKEKTIKQLEKRFQNQKKNNESVKSKLQEKEKEIKCLKKNRSLKHGHSGQLEKGTEEIHTLKRERSHRSLQNDIHELDKKLKGIEEENQKLLTQIKQIQQQKNIVVSQNVSLTKKIKQYQAESQMVQIHEEKEHKDVILQAESQEKTEYKQKINLLDENTALKNLVEKLRQELMAKRSSQVLEKKESLIDVLLQEYPSESISIRVTKKHDEESEKSEEEEDQVTKLKGQIQILKNKLSDYEDKEAIPFEGEEYQQLREVIIQTDNAQPRGVQIQDKWEAMAARIQAEDKDKVNQEEVSLKEVTTNTDLLTGFLLNFGSEQKKEDSNTTEKPKNDEIESPIKIEQEIEFREVTVQVESQEDIQNKDKIIEKLKKENDQKENEVTLLKRKIEELIREKKEIKNQEKIQSQNVRESGHKAVIEEEYPEENFSIRVTQKHGEDSDASEEDEDEVSRLRGEVQLLKNRLSEMEDKEAIPFEAVEEEQELREVVVQTTESGPEEPNEWERIAAKFEAEDKAKHADGAEALKEVTGNADLLSGFLMGMISQGEGAEKREDDKQESPEPKEGEVRTEVETLNEELQQLRNENEALMGVNRELQLKAQASGEALEEDYPEVAMNIRVSVKHDEDSELLDRAQAARLRQESEQLKERLEQLGEGEQIPFLDYAEEMKQEETRAKAKALQSEQANQREAKESTEELHQIIKKLQDQNHSLQKKLLIFQSQQKSEQARVQPSENQVMLACVSDYMKDLIQSVTVEFVDIEQRQLNQVIIQTEGEQNQIQSIQREFKEVVTQTIYENNFSNVVEFGENDTKNISKESQHLFVEVQRQNNMNDEHQNSSLDINAAPQGHNLQKQLGFDHIGDKYEDLLNDNSESDGKNGYIINNNQRTLLYTLQEEVSEWKNRYEQILKEKQIIEDELKKEKEMYISYELHPKRVKYEPQVQLSLDSGFQEEGFSKEGDEIKNQIMMTHKELTNIIAENKTLKAIIQKLQQQTKRQGQSSAVEGKPQQKQSESAKDLKDALLVQRSYTKKDGYSWDEEEMRKESENMNLRMITDETISLKEVSGNTEYLNELIHGFIDEDKKQQIEVQKEENIQKSQPEVKYMQQHLEEIVELEVKIKQMSQQIEFLKMENSRLAGRLNKYEQPADLILVETPEKAEKQKRELYQIRVSRKHDEESVTSEDNEVNKLKQEVSALKNKLSEYEDMESIPFEGAEEKPLKEVVTQTHQQTPQKQDQKAFKEWQQIAKKMEQEDDEVKKKDEKQIDSPIKVQTDLIEKQEESSGDIKKQQGQQANVNLKALEDAQKQKIIRLEEQNCRLKEELLKFTHKIQQKDSDNFRESGHKAVIEEEYPEENFSIRVTQKHGEDSDASEEDEDEVSRLRGEVQLLKNRLSEMEDKEAIPFEAVEEEQELREVVVQTTESGPEEPNEWERIAAKFEAEDKAKHADGAEALKDVTGNADLLSGFLMGMISQGEGAEKREDDKQESPEPKEGEVRTEVETLNEELQQLRNENEALMGANRELQLKAQASGEALEEDYPEVAMNIRVSVKHDEDSELLDRAQAARLRQESEQLKERLEQLGEGEQIPFLDFAEAMKQEETRAKALQSEQTNPREAKDSTEELHQIIKKLQDQNSSLRTELLKTKIDSSVQNNLLVQQKRVLQDLDRSILVWVSESINQLIQRVIISVESEQRQINKVVGQASLHEKDEDINLLQDCDNAYQIKSEVIHRPTIPQINAVLKQLQDLKAENKYLHELITFLKSPSSSKIQSCQQQQQDTVAQDNKDPYNQDREEVINSLTIPEEEVESSNQSKIKQKYAQKIQFEDSQTPKFDSEGHARFDKISDDKFISSLQNKNDQTAEQLSLKNEEIASLSTKIEWLESKLYKYKKMAAKYKREHKEVEQEELLQEIEIEEEEIEFNEVETQTNPYMFDQNGSMQKYTQQLEFKLDQELKVSTNLKNKLKRWQNILKKTHQNQEFEDFEDLQIEEENIQLSQVQIQVNYPASVTSFDQRPEEEAREKMKQRGKFFLSEIENLRQKFVGEDSESVDSENYSGRNTKRSVGSDEEQRTKLSHERMLELQLSHLYKDIYSIFKTHKFKLQEEIYVDNFKETLETFISYLKREKFLTGLKYNSFEDIKEQDGDDSLIERERKASIHRIGSDMILPEIDQSKAVQQPPKVENKENNVTIPPLFIEHERAIVQSLASFELSPLFITEVSYNPLNKESHNDTVLKLTRLSSEQLSQLITLLSAQLESLRDKIAIFEEVTQETLEQLVKLCGSDNLSRLLAQL